MTGTALAFPTPSSLGSLDHYIQAVNRFPLLTAEQEVALGRRLRQDDDLEAARELVLLMESGFSDKIKDESWDSYQHEYGSAGGAEVSIDLDTDLMRLAAGGSAG